MLATSLAATAEAQLVKRGTYSSQFGYHGTLKIHELEKEHVVVASARW